MSANEKILVDASQPATLLFAGREVSCLTLQEAVLEWHRQPEGERESATVRVDVAGGPVYSAKEIERLNYGPAPQRAA